MVPSPERLILNRTDSARAPFMAWNARPRVVSQLDCGGRCVDPVRAKSDTKPLTSRCQIEITALSLPDFASRHRQVAALIDWRRLIPPCERQRVAAIAGWVRRRSSCGFSTRRFHSAASRYIRSRHGKSAFSRSLANPCAVAPPDGLPLCLARRHA